MISFSFKILSPYENDLMETVRSFSAYIDINENSEKFIFEDNFLDGKYYVKISYNGITIEDSCDIFGDSLQRKKTSKRFGKILLYRTLSKITNIYLPYGSLTGVRPTKLFYELTKNGDNAEAVLSNTFDVSQEKVSLIKEIVNNQKTLYNFDEKAVDVFVNIPFCPTRCAYCSFVAVSMKQLAKYVDEYVILLEKEISILKNAILENSFKVRSVYFGGGTPTSLPVHLLQKLVSKCDFGQSEFTVEAGRPDTVNAEMLSMLADYGVNRISINPQTFWDKTLKKIGRDHTVEDTVNAYNLARKYPFSINMDLIAALPDETFEDFKYSIDKAISLSPENITVHTLALKRGSVLKVNEFDNSQGNLAEDMVNYSQRALGEAEYYPYYMYRQKYVTGNLENSGFTKKGFGCIYNVDIMEETSSILAAGAGAISKRVFSSKNRIERFANIKDVKGYIENFDDNLNKLSNFWKK